MKRSAAALAAAAFCAAAAAATAETPTMGWSSWNTYRVNISDALIMKQADLLVELGLDRLGYRYVNIDDGYFGGRDATGRLKTHPERFPNGLKGVVDHIHGLGLKAGIYSDGGGNTCGSFWDKDVLGVGVGFYGHDEQDAAFFFRDHDFDFIKIDFCGGDPWQNFDKLKLDERERYTAIRRAVDAVKPGVRLNVCRWNYPGTWVRDVGSSWRISADINPTWGRVKSIIKENLYLSAYAAPGAYNDMDMLEVGRLGSEVEDYTHFATWCFMSSPLLIGCDLQTVKDSPRLRALLSDRALIALNQDTAAPQGYVVRRDGDAYVLVRDVERPFGPKRAVLFLNLGDAEREMSVTAREIDLAGFSVTGKEKDLQDCQSCESCQNPVNPVKEELVFKLPPHGARVAWVEGRRLERTVYEAETAFLPAYQELHDPLKAGTAYYKEEKGASGGMVAANLGGRPGNDLVWEKVWSRDGGRYALALRTTGTGAEPVVRVNGEAVDAARPVALRPGLNEIRLSRDDAPMKDIDCLTLAKEDAP